MDNNILGIVAVVISVGSVIIGTLNHTRVKSMCCDKKIEMSLDIDKTNSLKEESNPSSS